MTLPDTLTKLRQVVIDEAKKLHDKANERGSYVLWTDDLFFAVRAMERHEARVAELEARLDREEKR